MSMFQNFINQALKDYDPAKDDPNGYVQTFRKMQHGRVNGDPSLFTNMQLIATTMNLFVAGTETTTVTLCWALFYLARNPDLQNEIWEEMQSQIGSRLPTNADRKKLPLIMATIMEVQRMADLDPVGVARRTLAPTKVAGYDIPAKTIVIPLLRAVFNDPKTYPNPKKFDPRRFLGKENEDQVAHLIPFMAGKVEIL